MRCALAVLSPGILFFLQIQTCLGPSYVLTSAHLKKVLSYPMFKTTLKESSEVHCLVENEISFRNI